MWPQVQGVDAALVTVVKSAFELNGAIHLLAVDATGMPLLLRLPESHEAAEDSLPVCHSAVIVRSCARIR